MNDDRILVINPGSTSTKLAVFDGREPVFEETLRHTPDELAAASMDEQLAFRTGVILGSLDAHGVSSASLAAIVSRGGLMRPVEGGTYGVNAAMLDDLRSKRYGDHASNLGAWIAKTISDGLAQPIPCFVADPVVVDELCGLARLSGCPDIERVSVFHALNQKAVARRYAASLGRRYDELCLIVAHMGGGVSVGAHEHGRVIDVNDALNGEGPFSAERSGGVPAAGLVKLCYSGRFSGAKEVIEYLTKRCGLMGYLGTNNGIETAKLARSDPRAYEVYRAMAYQVAKEIGAMAAVLSGRVDAIILTGGFAYDAEFASWISERTGFIAKTVVMPGEDEMTALNEAALRALSGSECVLEY